MKCDFDSLLAQRSPISPPSAAAVYDLATVRSPTKKRLFVSDRSDINLTSPFGILADPYKDNAFFFNPFRLRSRPLSGVLGFGTKP